MIFKGIVFFNVLLLFHLHRSFWIICLIKEIVGSMIEGVGVRIIIILRIEVIVSIWIWHVSLQLELLIRIVIELVHMDFMLTSNFFFESLLGLQDILPRW